MESGRLALGETSLYWESHGAGEPIVFLHAGVADSRMWRGQLHLEGCRTIVFDQRGFGKTAWSPAAYSDWEDAVAVLDELDVASAVVVGCSLGGSVAIHLALAAPERVRGLVLVGAAAGGWEPDGGWTEDPLWEEAEATAETGDLERIVQIDLEMWLAGDGRAVDDLDEELISLFEAMDRVPAATESERIEHAVRFGPTFDRLDEIDVPTLVVIGQYDIPDLHKSAAALADRLSDRPPVTIDDAAHLPSLEQPDRFNTALTGFLGAI